MKKSIHLSYILAFGMAFSSCAKVNNNNRKTSKQNLTQTMKMHPEQLQMVEISEGETKQISLFVKDGKGMTTQDMKIKWTLMAQEGSDVEVKKRFQTTEGLIDLQAGSSSLEIKLTAAMPDQEQQGDQFFLISMVNEAGISKKAILKLIDVKLDNQLAETTSPDQVQAVKVSIKETEISLTAEDTSEVTLILDQATKEDVMIEIDSLDNTAKAGKDYLNLKQAVSIPAGQKEAKIQIITLSQACDQDKDFTLKIVKAKGAKVENDSVKINLPVDKKVKCESASDSMTKD